MRLRTIWAAVGAAVTLLAGLDVPAAAVSAAARTQAQALGPRLGLIAVQQTVTIPEAGNRPGIVDPDVWITSYGSAFRLDVQRAGYADPVTVMQIISTPDGAGSRALPGSVLDGWNGLKDFIDFTLTNAHGKVVVSRQITFCPDDPNVERAIPASPATDQYPAECGSFDPFPLGEVWGLPQGWAVDSFASVLGAPGPVMLVLATGKYRAAVSIAPQYRTLFGVGARAATATVGIDVVDAKNCSPAACATARPNDAAGPAGAVLSTLPSVPTMTRPPQAALPQLTALPSWGIATSSQSGHDWLDFGATVWVGGNAPLDVEGSTSPGSPLLAAYQYFWQNGEVIGRAQVGSMGFDSQKGHNHWHFEQFAQYQLLTANQELAVRSQKVGFCIAPSDAVDLLLPDATWQPSNIGLAGQCGLPGALWVQEYLPVGWGDTYDQSKAGQAFDITSLPNGVYYIEIIADPLHQLYELSTVGNISLRAVISAERRAIARSARQPGTASTPKARLTGTPGVRTPERAARSLFTCCAARPGRSGRRHHRDVTPQVDRSLALIVSTPCRSSSRATSRPDRSNNSPNSWLPSVIYMRAAFCSLRQRSDDQGHEMTTPNLDAAEIACSPVQRWWARMTIKRYKEPAEIN